MWASWDGHHDIVRTLLEGGANINAKNNVRNQMMMMMMLIIVLTILMMMMMMMMKIIIYDEDRGVCR
jgi:ankyrin repeat protein